MQSYLYKKSQMASLHCVCVLPRRCLNSNPKKVNKGMLGGYPKDDTTLRVEEKQETSGDCCELNQV